MFKSMLKFLLVLSLASTHAYASEKQEASKMSSFHYLIYTTRPIASFITYSVLQYYYGGLALKTMGGIVFLSITRYYLLGTIETTNKKTDGQNEDLSNFKERFGRETTAACKGSSLGALWTGNHALLKVQILDERYEDMDSNSICHEYYFETYPGEKGIALSSEDPLGSSVEIPLDKTQASTIQEWLVEFDRKAIPWDPQTNSCIDFVFEAFKALGHQANLLPWLGRFDTGLTSTKISMLKYLMKEDFPSNPTVSGFSLNPWTLLVSTVCDLIINPLYTLTLLSNSRI